MSPMPAGSHYAKAPCRICRQQVSIAGRATLAHLRAHQTRGEADQHGNCIHDYLPIFVDGEFMGEECLRCGAYAEVDR